jgi:hypothetical protein
MALPPLISPPAPASAHRSAVLDRSASRQAELANLVNRFAPLAPHDDSDTEDRQVSSPSHTHTARFTPSVTLPAAFVPTAIGSDENAIQRFTAIVDAVKRGTKAPYSNINELNEALDDWATSWRRAGYSADKVEAVRRYQNFLVQQLTFTDRIPFKQVLEYHRKWCKAVHEGEVDMFAANACYHPAILHAVTHPLNFTPHTTSSSSSRGPKSKSDKSSSKAPPSGSSPPAKFPAGSCTHHPNSTSHTTEQCQKKGQ